ncbi:MAG: ISNCY family transposase ISTde1 [Candidatus Omnitrophica bacterium CG_4_9_14_0_2_um_filter_43_12]|nr:MAG: ISNCY family transposase ISTde1 [Candidatus Omnitrophica bacterium CG_4_9_14_0_2_um_filter_43_12]
MAGKDIYMATQEELRRLHIIRKAIDKRVTQKEAAGILELSQRQISRIAKRIRIEGDIGIIHRSRGELSNRAMPDRIKSKALKLFQEKYSDFGPTLATEKLFEIDKIKLNDETLRLWLIEKHIPYKKRKKRPHRQWRERKHHFGEMIQIDGSHHDWFEQRAPKCVLMGYVDDATGCVFARFYTYEGTMPFMDSFKRYIERHGIPQSVYLDRYSAYKAKKKQTIEDELNNVIPLSAVQKALGELSVDIIYAFSPQAKGRVERQFNTFQDRLIKEMRLKGIRTISEANMFLGWYLPIYNKRFAKEPAMPDNLHRPVPKTIDLERIFRIKTQRALRNDFTVAHENKLYQIKNNIRVDKVIVEERLNGSIEITHKGISLRFKQILIRPQIIDKRELTFKPRKVYVPPVGHPWKRPMYNGYLQKEKFAQKEKELLLTTT